MIESEEVNEFIENMKLKKSVVGGIREDSVYENMRALSDLYEAQIEELKKKISDLEDALQKKDASLQEEKLAMDTIFINTFQAHQLRINEFQQVINGFSDEVADALAQYLNRYGDQDENEEEKSW